MDRKKAAKWIDKNHQIGVHLCKQMYLNYEKEELDNVDDWVFVEKSGRIALYEKQDEYIVVFRGTNTTGNYSTVSKDLYDDISLATGKDQYVSIVSEGNDYIDSLISRGIAPDKISLTGHSLGGYAALKVSDKYDIKSFVFNAAAPPTNPIKKGPGKISYNYHIVGDGISSHMGKDTSNIIRAYKNSTFFKTPWNHDLNRFYETDPTYGFYSAQQENQMFFRDKNLFDIAVDLLPPISGTQWLPPVVIEPIPGEDPTGKPDDGEPGPGQGEDDPWWLPLFLLFPFFLKNAHKAKKWYDRLKKLEAKGYQLIDYSKYKTKKLFTRKDLESPKIYKDALYPLRSESANIEETDLLKRIRKQAEAQWDVEGRNFTQKKITSLKEIDRLKYEADIADGPRNPILQELHKKLQSRDLKEKLTRADRVNSLVNADRKLNEKDLIFIDKELENLQEFFESSSKKIKDWWILTKEKYRTRKIQKDAVQNIKSLDNKAKRNRENDILKQEEDFKREMKKARLEIDRIDRLKIQQIKKDKRLKEIENRINRNAKPESLQAAKTAEGAYKKDLKAFKSFKPPLVSKPLTIPKVDDATMINNLRKSLNSNCKYFLTLVPPYTPPSMDTQINKLKELQTLGKQAETISKLQNQALRPLDEQEYKISEQARIKSQQAADQQAELDRIKSAEYDEAQLIIQRTTNYTPPTIDSQVDAVRKLQDQAEIVNAVDNLQNPKPVINGPSPASQKLNTIPEYTPPTQASQAQTIRKLQDQAEIVNAVDKLQNPKPVINGPSPASQKFNLNYDIAAKKVAAKRMVGKGYRTTKIGGITKVRKNPAKTFISLFLKYV